MRTKNRMRHLAWGVLGLLTQQAFSQATQPDNLGGAASFLGWDAGANQTLEVRNDANKSIDWFTDAIRRLTLLPNATYTIGSFPAQVKDGSLLLCPDVDQFYFNGGNGPYSLLHLAAADDNDQNASFRDWMNIGMTMIGNADQNYFGQKAAGLDSTDLELHWSDLASAGSPPRDPAAPRSRERCPSNCISGHSTSSARSNASNPSM
jgi:hypothetical protein